MLYEEKRQQEFKIDITYTHSDNSNKQKCYADY